MIRFAINRAYESSKIPLCVAAVVMLATAALALPHMKGNWWAMVWSLLAAVNLLGWLRSWRRDRDRVRRYNSAYDRVLAGDGRM